MDLIMSRLWKIGNVINGRMHLFSYLNFSTLIDVKSNEFERRFSWIVFAFHLYHKLPLKTMLPSSPGLLPSCLICVLKKYVFLKQIF